MRDARHQMLAQPSPPDRLRQGGSLSPLLANVMLDDVDQELTRRGLRFERYADDCNIYVRSHRAGVRVLAHLRKLYAKLKLRINEAKTTVRSVFGAKFLGYALWKGRKDEVKRGRSRARLWKPSSVV